MRGVDVQLSGNDDVIKAYERSRRTASLILNLGARLGVGGSGQLHVQAVLPQEKPPVLIHQEDGWAPEPVWTSGEDTPSCHCRDWNRFSSCVDAAA